MTYVLDAGKKIFFKFLFFSGGEAKAADLVVEEQGVI